MYFPTGAWNIHDRRQLKIAETDIFGCFYFLSRAIVSAWRGSYWTEAKKRREGKRIYRPCDSVWIRRHRNDHGFHRWCLFIVVALSLLATRQNKTEVGRTQQLYRADNFITTCGYFSELTLSAVAHTQLRAIIPSCFPLPSSLVYR